MQITVGKKITAIFSIILLLMLFAAMVSAYQLKNSANNMSEITEEKEIILKCLDLQANLAERNHILLDILLFGQNEQMFTIYINELETSTKTIDDMFIEIMDDLMRAKINVLCIQAIDELQQHYEQDNEQVTRLINTYRVNGKKAALNMVKDFNYNQIMDSAIEKLKEDNDKKFKEMSRKYTRGIIIAITFFGLAVLLAVVIATQIGKHLVTNIIYLTNAADEISLGSLETPIQLKSNDELEELAQVFDRLRLDIKEAMEKLGKK